MAARAFNVAVASGAVPIYMGRAASAFWEGPWIVTGDSLTDFGYAANAFSFGFPKSMRSPFVAWNAGVQAQNMNQFNARFQATIDQFPNVQNYLIRIGTNGVGSGTYLSQFTTIYNVLVANGKRAVMCAIPPKGLGTPGVPAAHIAINQELAALCAAHPQTLKYLHDSTILGTVDYNGIPELYTETSAPVHPNGKGTYLWGTQFGPLIANVLPPNSFLLNDPSDIWPANAASNQWVQNPFMAGTAGSISAGVSGVLPTGWAGMVYSATTVVCSIVPADVGDPNQTPWMDIAPTSSSNSGTIGIQAPMVHPAIDNTTAAIKRYEVAAEMRLVNYNSDYITGVSVYVTSGNVGRSPGAGIGDARNGILNERVLLRSTLPRDQGPSNTVVTPVAAAANTLNIGVWIKCTSFAAAAGSVQIRCVSVRGLST